MSLLPGDMLPGDSLRRTRFSPAPRIFVMKLGRWALGGILLAMAAAGAWRGWPAADDGVRYRSAKIERGALQAVVSSSGTVTPVSQVSVGSQVSGQIAQMLADFNTEVKKGQLIARIDPQSFETRVRQAGADLEAARAAVLNAQANAMAVAAGVSKARLDADNAARDAQRKRELAERQFISQAESDNAANLAATLAEALEVAMAQHEVALAQVVSAQAVVRQRAAALAQAEVDLRRTEIRSPIDGVVIKRSVDVGQTVAASLQAPELFIIARSLADMQVEAAIDEADIGRIRVDQPASFTIDAFAGRSFEGRVRQIRKAAIANQNVVTYTVVVAFANPGSALLPGMTANVRIVTDTRDDVLKVPNAALRVRIAGLEPVNGGGGVRTPPPEPRGGAAVSWLPSAVAAAPVRPASAAAAPEARRTTRGRIHLLGADGKPVAYAVQLGISDGAMTELIVPPDSADAGVLKEGAEVVTAVVSPKAAGARGAAPAFRAF